VPDPGHLGGVAGALGNGVDAIVEAWIDGYDASRVRLPGHVDRAGLSHLITPTADALAEALDGVTAVSPGGAALREVEKELSFLGAALVAQGATAFDGVALVLALRDALSERVRDAVERRHLAALFDWFVAVAMEGVARANSGGVFERHRELLEERSPVVLMGAELPVAFPLGDEDTHGMRGVMARLVMSIARVGARAVIVDASGLTGAASAGVVAALREYCTHRKIAGSVALVVCGLEARAERPWRDVARDAGVELHLAESFPHAMQVATKC